MKSPLLHLFVSCVQAYNFCWGGLSVHRLYALHQTACTAIILLGILLTYFFFVSSELWLQWRLHSAVIGAHRQAPWYLWWCVSLLIDGCQWQQAAARKPQQVGGIGGEGGVCQGSEGRSREKKWLYVECIIHANRSRTIIIAPCHLSICKYMQMQYFYDWQGRWCAWFNEKLMLNRKKNKKTTQHSSI